MGGLENNHERGKTGLFEEQPACEHFFIQPFIIKDQLITVLQSEAGL